MECSSRFNFDLPQFPFRKRAAKELQKSPKDAMPDEAIVALLVYLLRPSKPLSGTLGGLILG